MVCTLCGSLAQLFKIYVDFLSAFFAFYFDSFGMRLFVNFKKLLPTNWAAIPSVFYQIITPYNSNSTVKTPDGFFCGSLNVGLLMVCFPEIALYGV